MEKEFPKEDESLIRRNEAVYGDTDLNPNDDDQHDEHEADADDVV